jgi:hypothetical protein
MAKQNKKQIEQPIVEQPVVEKQVEELRPTTEIEPEKAIVVDAPKEQIKEETLVVPEVENTVPQRDKIEVDKQLFFEALNQLVRGYTRNHSFQPAILSFGKMLGFTTYEECVKSFRDGIAYLEGLKK